MSRPAIQSIKLNKHITLSECHPDSECRAVNWWMYDERAYGGMNIGMREKTRDEAFVAAIEFWAERAIKAELAHSHLKSQVDAFVGQFIDEDED